MTRKLTRVQSEGIKDDSIRSEDLTDSAIGLRELDISNKASAVTGMVVGIDAGGNLSLLTVAGGGVGLSLPTTATAGQILTWNGSLWVASDAPTSTGGTGGTTLPTATDGQIIAWNTTSNMWEAIDMPAGASLPIGTDGQVMTWDTTANDWVAKDLPASAGGAPEFEILPADGDFDDSRIAGGKPPAVLGWTPTTKIAQAMDDLNEIVGMLLPDPPAQLSSKTLSFTGDPTPTLYATGYTDNTGSGPTAGSDVAARASGGSVTSDLVTDFGSGNSGTLTVLVDNVNAGSIVLTGADNSGVDGSLEITADADFPPAIPGFFQALSAQVSGTLGGPGLHDVQLEHSETGSTNTAQILLDHVVPAPTCAITQLVEGPVTTALSSGIPHYSANSQLRLDADGTNLSTDAYLKSGIFRLGGTNGIGPDVNINAGDSGLPAVFAKDVATASVTAAGFTIQGDVHTSAKITCSSGNPDERSSTVSSTDTILVMSGTATAAVDEMAIPVSNTLGAGSGDGSRVNLSDELAFDSSAAKATDEASVVGGKIKQDTTNYTTGFMPVGPDYSTHDATQSFEFEFTRSSVSKFDIQIDGTYSGLEVKLPGVAGWWDMTQLYPGAGLPNPGCASGTVASGSGTFGCTFGTETSTNSTGNKILVKLTMSAGDVVNSIEIL